MKNILTSKIPLFYLFILIIITGYSTYLITDSYYKIQKSLLWDYSPYDATTNTTTCEYQTKRLGGYDFIKPLLYVDKNCETGVFTPVKQILLEMIDKDKLAGTITTASVYVRDFNQGDFMSINEDQKYTPEELMKVPLLITCIHKDEENSGFFEKQFSYAKAYHNEKNTNEKDAEIIKVGRKYTVKQLLEYMMIDGDNNAASLLYENIDLLSYQKTFTDLGLAAPDRVSMNFPISAKDYSLFMRTLYNATYLTIPNSEYATELLTKCKDKGGILIGMPVNEKMAHKFGECTSGTEKQLHESAIIYVNNYPYLITIMTKGNNIKNLSSVISKISSVVYKQIAAHN